MEFPIQPANNSSGTGDFDRSDSALKGIREIMRLHDEHQMRQARRRHYRRKANIELAGSFAGLLDQIFDMWSRWGGRK